MELSSKEMHIWRIAGAIGWSIVFQFMFLYCYIFIANLNFWHPFNAFSVSFSSIFSLTTLLNIFPLALVIFCQGFLCSRDYIIQRNNQVSNTRFSLLLNFFTIYNFTTLVLFSFVGITLAHVHTSVLNERLNSFSTLCPNQIERCLNEERFFLVCDGLCMGIFFFIKSNIFRSSKALFFPPIQQEKFIRIQSSFLPCVRNSFAKSIVPSLIFYVCYFFKGNYLRSTFSSIFQLQSKNEGLDSVFTLADFELMFYLWMLSTTFIVTLEMMEILFNIYLTERAIFPVSTLLALPADHVPLQNALMCDNVPIIQHLGFYDLSFLAEFDDERRAQLFTLSQPGGHARTWNCISGQCFKVINSFLDDLDKAFDETRLTLSEVNSNKKHDLSAPNVPIQEHIYSPRIRCLSPVVVQSHPVSTSTIQKSYEQVLKNCSTWFDEKLNAFYKKPLIVYLFGDMIEPRVKQLSNYVQITE
ncbi:nucleoporin NDC1 [Nilaparvata lugens]|uniref:nucleoporin NDC1 n=1 Tax=Nilaparvata lugens TaxID=108931 RepID=UPI00193E258B|nr:nucleoporin NDC1 [Nilaparvata lugens]